MLWKCLSTERTFALLLAGSTLLMGCEHEASLDQARASAEAHQAEGVVAAAGKNPEQLKKAISRIRSIRGGTKIQQANRDLLLASTQIKLGQIEVDAFNTIELSLRNEISHLNSLIDLMHSLQVFIDKRDISIDQLGSGPLQQQRSQLETTKAALHRQLNDMQAPVSAMDEENASQSARISDLRRAAESLREEQASLGLIEGFDAFQRSIEVDNEADKLAIEVARRQILLDLETQPIIDHTRLASVQTQEHIEEVTAAHGTLESIVDSYSSQSSSARTLLNRMNDEVNAAMQSLNEQDTGPLTHSYASARSTLEKAAGDARSGSRGIDKTGKNAASFLQSQAHLLVFQVDGSRLRGLMERQGLLGRLSSSQIIGNRDSYAMQLKKVENTIAEVNAGAKSAGEAAVQALGNVRGGEVDQIRSEIETTMNMMGIEFTAAPTPPAMPGHSTPAPTTAPQATAGPRFDTPRRLLEYVTSLNSSDMTRRDKILALMDVEVATTPEAIMQKNAPLEAHDVLADFELAARESGHAELVTKVKEMTSMQDTMGVSPFPFMMETLETTSDTTAKVNVEYDLSHVGSGKMPGHVVHLVKTSEGWKVDLDNQDQEGAGGVFGLPGEDQFEMDGFMEGILGTFKKITRQIRNGTITTGSQLNKAFLEAMQGDN